MSAEELDKLFKSKLNNRPVAPSNEAWERLQARMQPPVQQEERKPVMWYYSAAAAVTLLVGVGFWTMNQPGGLESSGTVAAIEAPKASTNNKKSAPTPEDKLFEKNSQVQATEIQPLASSSQEGLVAKADVTKNRNTIDYPSSKPEKRSGTTSFRKEEKPIDVMATPEMIASSTPNKKSPEVTPQEEPLEIIIKLDNNYGEAIALAQPEPVDEPSEEKGSARVLKGILKQVKNLKDGEKVSLSELGITKHTYALETRIGNKTISKTIQL